MGLEERNVCFYNVQMAKFNKFHPRLYQKKLKFCLFGSELVIAPFLITFSAMATF